MARVTSVVGQSRSSISVLTEASISPQAPLGRPNLHARAASCPPGRPPGRHASSSRAMRSLAATISLNVSAILPSSPVWSPGSRTEKSPIRMACNACSNSCMPNEWPFNRPLPSSWTALASCRVGRDRSTGCRRRCGRSGPWEAPGRRGAWQHGLAALGEPPFRASLVAIYLARLLAVYSPVTRPGRASGRRPDHATKPRHWLDHSDARSKISRPELQKIQR